MERKRKILQENFIYFKDADITDFESLSYEENKYFFDTENAPIFPQDIVDKYNLTNVEYDSLDVFKDVSENGLLNKLLKNKQITTKIYCWQFGCNNSDKVFWGNTIQEFIDFIEDINLYRVEQDHKITEFDIYVHNLAWDIEFFKYYFKDKHFQQIRSSNDRKERTKNEKLEDAFSITETDGTVHNARIQLQKKTIKKGKKKINYLTTLCFFDSAKITPKSLKDISENMIKVDEIYIKNSDVYQYNTVRDPENFKPSEIESWYIYCDIYLLKEWYNQFVKVQYIDNGIKAFTISQIAFDSILKETYKDGILRRKYRTVYDKKDLTDRQVYERHFALKYIEKVPLFKEYFRLSYKGGHTTCGGDYQKLASTNKATIKGVSMDITSSYPGQMTYQKLPFGKPYYYQGKYKDHTTKDNEFLDYHFITIAFDGFTSIQEGNQFGLNVKLRGLEQHQKEYLNCSTNESATTNIIEGEFVGYNRIEVKDKKRSKLISKFKNAFVVTVPHKEFEEWERNFNFYYYEEGKLKKGVRFVDYVSLQSEVGHYAKGLDHFFKIKEENDQEGGNKVLKENAKLIINSFYGKHCSRRDREERYYDFTKDVICFQQVTEENINQWEDEKLYAVHYGSAVTSYGRIQLRETCRKIGSDKFIYADTDSLKFEMTYEELQEKVKQEHIPMSFCTKDKHLSFWDFEFKFDDFKAVGQKKYMYLKEGQKDYICKCAGLPSDIRKQITTKEQFAIGKEFVKKAKRKIIGGNLLIDISYSISDLLRN